MKTLQLVRPRVLEIAETPEPGEPGPNDVLVRIHAVGICGSDLHYYRGEPTGADLPLPFVMGHECAGVVRAVGERVDHLRPGDRVALDPNVACGRCDACREGHPHVCPNARFLGSPGVPGALRDLIVHPGHLAVPLPPSLSHADGALLEPLGVALHAIDIGGLRIADTVAVLGCGPIGQMVIVLAKLGGAREIFATDVHDFRLRAAKRCGATETVNVAREDPVRAILEATGGRGVDVAFEAAGAEHAVEHAAAVAKRLGTVVIIGIAPVPRTAVEAAPARRKGLTLRIARRMMHVYARTVPLVERHMVDLAPLISHTLPFERGADAFRLAADYGDEAQKIVIVNE
jgi:L-iditol 2-dehydrogenase